MNRMTDAIVTKLREVVLNMDDEGAEQTARELVGAGLDPVEGIKSMASAMTEMGEKFERGEAFVPELILASDALKRAMPILEDELRKRNLQREKFGTVIVGTVKGDVHEVGKDIVTMMLGVAGFDVIDLGADVSASDFIAAAQSHKADAIAMSSLLSTTMAGQREVIEFLKELGLRDKYKVLVGGGPVKQTWADEIGADGYAQDAIEAVKLAKRVLARN